MRVAFRVAWFLGSLASLAGLACSVKAASVGAGAECFSASDCDPGLVCVPQRGGARLCSNDVSKITGNPPSDSTSVDASGDETDAMPMAPALDASTRDAARGDAGDAS